MLTNFVSGKTVASSASALCVPLLTMFMPIASPVVQANLKNKERPATAVLMACRLAKRDELLNAERIRSKFSGTPSHCTMLSASRRDGVRSTGERVMPSLSNAVTAPPHCVMARAPLFADATKQPSVVAMGMWYNFPSTLRGPNTPTGMGI